MDYQTGLCFVTFLIVAFSTSVSTQFYSVDFDGQSFNDAQNLCAPDGFLANMPSEEETNNILNVIKDKGYTTSTSYWIGLKIEKGECVQQNLPLKGFYWTVDNSTKFDLNKWKEDPPHTCTTALCGLLSVEYRGSTLVSWGLSSMSCNKKFPFICKHKASSKNIACSSKPKILGAHYTTEKNYDPYTLKVSCSATDIFMLTCSKNTGKWKLVGGTETDIQELCLICNNGYKKDKDGKCVDVDECKQFNNCTFICFNLEGSYNCMCVEGMSNFHNEISEICQKQKKAKTSIFTSATDDTKKVKDETTSSSMDKNSPSSSQLDIYSTVESQLHNEKSSGDFSNIIIPLIIALLIFVVLVVIIVAIVKYCLMRSARKRAKERAAALKESLALNGSDSMEKVNE